jgi:hypothetical protein
MHTAMPSSPTEPPADRGIPPAPDLSPIRDPRIAGFARLWLRLRGVRTMPSRRDLDPLDFPDLLPCVWLADVLPGPRFRYRLAGEAVIAVFGVPMRGRFMEEVIRGARWDAVGPRYAAMVRRPAVSHAIGRIFQLDGRTYPGERLVLPLASDGRTPDGLVGITLYDLSEGSRDEPPRETVTTIPLDGGPPTAG